MDQTLTQMHKIARLLALLPLLAFSAFGQTFDTPLRIATREDLLDQWSALRHELSEQESLDLSIAIHAIQRQCDDENVELSTAEREDLCVALVDGRTPRQVILTAAAMMIAASAELERPNAPRDGSKLEGEAYTRWNYLMKNRTLGLGFVKEYAGAAKKGQSSQKASE